MNRYAQATLILLALPLLLVGCIGGTNSSSNGDGQGGSGAISPDAFESIEAGYMFTCGIRGDGQAVCWGRDAAGQASPPDGTFQKLAVGRHHGCGILTDGTVTCWGSDSYGETDAPDGQFVDLDVDKNHSCGVRDTGDVECWGFGSDRDVDEEQADLIDYDWDQSVVPDGRFKAIATALNTTCGLEESGEVVCWGDPFVGDAPTDGSTFESIVGGPNHFCGITPEDVIKCWGAPGIAPEPPESPSVSVGTGYVFDCSIDTNGETSCWGMADEEELAEYGATPVPDGRFSQLSVGYFHVCALNDRGDVTCWGRDSAGETVPPPYDVIR